MYNIDIHIETHVSITKSLVLTYHHSFYFIINLVMLGIRVIMKDIGGLHPPCPTGYLTPVGKSPNISKQVE